MINKKAFNKTFLLLIPQYIVVMISYSLIHNLSNYTLIKAISESFSIKIIFPKQTISIKDHFVTKYSPIPFA